MAVDFVGIQSTEHLNRMFQFTDHNITVLPTIKRTGHARFRRGPSLSTSSSDSHGPSTSTQSAPLLFQSTQKSNEILYSKSATETTSSSLSLSSRSTNSSSLLSPLNSGEEGSVSNGKQFSGLGIVAPAPTFSNRKPPLPSSHRKRCRAERPSLSLLGSSSSGCHCKRRKISSKRVIIRVPITGTKLTNIPADDYSWKKYGEKRIDGSNYPRVYYKCNTGKGCPVRKSVEFDIFDSKMLIVTYAGEHIHAPTTILTGLTDSVALSNLKSGPRNGTFHWT